MPVHHFPQSVAARPQGGASELDVPHGERESVSPWLTSIEACDHLRFTGKYRLLSLYRYLKREGIPVSRRSPKRLLIARADLDRAIRKHQHRSLRSASSR